MLNPMSRVDYAGQPAVPTAYMSVVIVTNRCALAVKRIIMPI